jgi:hypothetical protein
MIELFAVHHSKSIGLFAFALKAPHLSLFRVARAKSLSWTEVHQVPLALRCREKTKGSW